MADSSRTTLGIEGGGTKTEWVLLDDAGQILREGRLPAASMKLADDEELLAIFHQLPPQPTEVGLFLAGCLIDRDRARLWQLGTTVWPHARLKIGSDRESGLAAALGERDGIVVISGTGGVVHGRAGNRLAKSGGWGQILGDRGGAYDLARRALRRVMYRYDLDGTVIPFGVSLLTTLSLNELSQLVDWVHDADKHEVARLAPLVIRVAETGEAEMAELVHRCAQDLALFTQSVARRLELPTPEVRLCGGLLTKEPFYASAYREHLRPLVPGAVVEASTRSGALGAAALVRAENADGPSAQTETKPVPSVELAPAQQAVELAAAATEQTHPESLGIQHWNARQLVDRFVAEEHRVQAALAACAEPLARGVDVIVAALQGGGRLFYIGAGTSGRLGVLDASEMPPTFGTAPELVQGVIAGGAPALTRSAEAAEDSPEAGAQGLAGRGVCAGDVVCGITASGRTPFVLGALAAAREVGAATIFLTCNPQRYPSKAPWDVEIDLPTGPEIVTGSTRLKAGTATKVALNILSTSTMIRLGHVRDGAMVDVRATNVKLRDRAIRIVSEGLGIDAEAARQRLEATGWQVRDALGA